MKMNTKTKRSRKARNSREALFKRYRAARARMVKATGETPGEFDREVAAQLRDERGNVQWPAVAWVTVAERWAPPPLRKRNR